ncbi:MAG: hypothetical protein LBE18_09945 [Planctomycetaceae bacterium]|nr:hypothetical protein [Planctomycetaceae bacterium]
MRDWLSFSLQKKRLLCRDTMPCVSTLRHKLTIKKSRRDDTVISDFIHSHISIKCRP